MKAVRVVLLRLYDDDEKIKSEGEIEVTRMGKYETERAKLMKMTLKPQATIEEMLARTYILKGRMTMKMCLSGGT